MSESGLVRPVEVLLVEDNPGDVELTRDALAQCKLHNRCHVVTDGQKAIEFLHRRGAYADMPRPDLILLDLNLPRKDGREVLAEIKEHEDFRRIPVVVLTGSRAEDDVLKSYNLHANCYITKPLDVDGFLQVVRAIETFWLSVVVLPPDGDEK